MNPNWCRGLKDTLINFAATLTYFRVFPVKFNHYYFSLTSMTYKIFINEF